MEKKRETNFDLLRIVCTVAVVFIHVSATYKTAITDDSFFGFLYKEHMFTILIYNTLSRFAVPCFFMLSGAFLLADDKNAEYSFWYRKSLITIGIPTIVFSLLYFIYSEILACGSIIKGGGISEVLSPIKNVVVGAPFYHMWYLYTLIGLYLIIPVIIRIKNSIGEDMFKKVSIVILLITVISGWTSSFILNWSISKSVCYLGYLVIGYQLRKSYLEKKNNFISVCLILSGVILEIALTFVQYEHSLSGLAEIDEKYSVVGHFNPLVVMSSILIFAGFSRLSIRCSFDGIIPYTFYIYFFHAGIWDILSNLFKEMGIKVDCRMIIPLGAFLVFLMSYLVSILYCKMWEMLEKRYSISKRICRCFGMK